MAHATIEIINTRTAKVTGEFSFAKLSKAVSYRPSGYKYSTAFQAGYWDGYTRLINKRGEFAAGLRSLVEAALIEQGCAVEIVDRRKRPSLKIKHTNEIKLNKVDLYPWQKKAIRIALISGQGIIKAATGAGKTEMLAGIIACLSSDIPPKTLILVPNRNLLIQTKERLELRLSLPVGVIGGGVWEEDWVTVAIPNSMVLPKFKAKREALMCNCELLMVDEVHHLSSSMFAEAVDRCRAWYRFGVSGTPLDRQDGSSLKLQGLTGPVIVDIPSSTLVSQGKLARPTVRFLSITKPVLPPNLSWPDVYGLGVVANRHLIETIVRIAESRAKQGKFVLILVTQIQQGHNIAERLSMEHIFVWGESPDAEIADALRRFRAKQLPILIGSAIFGEGADIPAIDVLVVGDGGKSAIKTVQKAGRALRVKEGKENVCEIIDFAHQTHRLLKKHSYLRFLTYSREDMRVVDPPEEVSVD